MKRSYLIFLLLFGCISDDIKGRLYTIKAGSHESTPRKLGFFRGDVLRFQAKFDSSAVYTLEGSDQSDINKLYGFSDCGNVHHKSSARLGWKWEDNRLQIWAYSYADGNRTMEYLTDIPINEFVSYSIEKHKKYYTICADGVCVDTDRSCSSGFSYWLNPYFGGTSPAPHDVRVWIE